MSLRYLLDTQVVASPAAKNVDAEVLRRLEKKGRECAIPAPVWTELLLGVEALPAGSDRRATFERYLQDVVRQAFPVVPFDDAAAAWHARETARQARAGKRMGTVDGQIAAIAVTTGMALVTTLASVKVFEGVPGLRVERWGSH